MGMNIHVVINPASGQPQPILHTLNHVFRATGASWGISLTQESGDAERFARQAAAAGADVVAAYGGDGTVMEVARGLIGSPATMAILPGGTANLLSVELGIPKKLELAAGLICDPNSQVRQVDAGMVGETFFLLRVGCGFPAHKVELADRQLKDKYGIMAYSIAALKALSVAKMADYRLTLDGQVTQAKGMACVVDNAGNMGTAWATHGKNISVSDGLLDVILVKDASFGTMIEVGQALADHKPSDSYLHWQAREIGIEADPPQPVQIDGEVGWQTPISIRVMPGVLKMLVPGGVNGKK